MAFTPVKPNDPLDQPSHSGLHNQHSQDVDDIRQQHSQDVDDINEAQALQDGKITDLENFDATLAGGDAGEVLTKSTNDDYDWEWIPAPTGGDGGDTYPGISTEQPNGLGLGTDGGLQVDPATLLSDADGQNLTLDDEGKIYGGGKVLGINSTIVSTDASSNEETYQKLTGMSLTFTPQSSTSLVLVSFDFSAFVNGVNGMTNPKGEFQIKEERTSSIVHEGSFGVAVGEGAAGIAVRLYSPLSFSGVHSMNESTANTLLTYQLYARVDNLIHAAYIKAQNGKHNACITVVEVEK